MAVGKTPISKASVARLSSAQRKVYDTFYDANGNSKIPGLDIADSFDQYQNYTGTGIQVNGDMVQVTFTYDDKSTPQARALTVTYNPNDPSSLAKSLTYLPGDGGLGLYVPSGKYIHGSINDYYLDGNADYTAIMYDSTYHSEVADHAIPQILNLISDTPVSSQRQIVAGSSAGTVGLVNTVAERFAPYYNSATRSYDVSNANPVDILLLDAKGEGSKGPAQPFAEELSSVPGLKQALKESSSVVYAYEASGGLTGRPEAAIPALKSVAKDGPYVVLSVNDSLNSHAGLYAPDRLLTTSEPDKVFSDFTDVHGNDIDRQNRYYIVDPYDDSGLKRNSDGSLLTLTDMQLHDYLSSYREDIAKSSYGLNQVEKIHLDTTKESNELPEESFSSIDYQSVIDFSNEIINSINNTAFQNKTFDYAFSQESTSDFPNSLNDANSVLYGASTTLIANIAHDMKNVEQILNNYSTLDYNLSVLANSLNTNIENTSVTGTLEEIALNGSHYNEMNNRIVDIFDQQITEGNVGKIAMSDINSILSGSTLTGQIGEGLRDEIHDANELKNNIDNLMNNAQIQDPVWDAMKERFLNYSELCDARAEAAEKLERSYVEALQRVKDYIEPDEYLDDGEIPLYEEKKTNATNQKTSLEEANITLSQVTVSVTKGIDENGKPYEIVDTTAYDEAQAQIAINNEKIAELEVEIETYDAFITKLKGFQGVLNEANSIISNALSDVRTSYATKANELSPVNVSSNGLSPIVPTDKNTTTNPNSTSNSNSSSGVNNGYQDYYGSDYSPSDGDNNYIDSSDNVYSEDIYSLKNLDIVVVKKGKNVHGVKYVFRTTQDANEKLVELQKQYSGMHVTVQQNNNVIYFVFEDSNISDVSLNSIISPVA